MENFLELLEYNLKIFLTYDISLDIPQKSMQLHVGNLAINPQKIWDSNYLVDFTNQHEIYRNLLTVSSTSFNITLELNYKEAPKHVLADFLLDTLKFQLIRRIHSEEFMDQQTFYASENYFNGLLVRTSQKDHLMINLKLYAKFEHQIVKLVQAIYTNYGEECTVTLQNKFDEEIARKMLEQCLIEEIGHTLGDQTNRDFIRKQLQKELCTDISYQNLKRKL